MKTFDKISAEIEMATKHGLSIPGFTKTAISERKASATRIAFLRECLRVVQILSVEAIQSQLEKVLEKIGKYELAIKKANELPSKVQINQATKDAIDYYKPSQLNQQRDILEYIHAD